MARLGYEQSFPEVAKCFTTRHWQDQHFLEFLFISIWAHTENHPLREICIRSLPGKSGLLEAHRNLWRLGLDVGKMRLVFLGNIFLVASALAT